MKLNFIQPRAHIKNPTDEQLEYMISDLHSVSALHLIQPEDDEDDGATNRSFIVDMARELGLPENSGWEEVYPTMLEEGYEEIRVTHSSGSNHFFLRESEMDRFEWLDPYLK